MKYPPYLRRIIIRHLVACLICLCAGGMLLAQTPIRSAGAGRQFANDELLIRFKPGVAQTAIKQLLGQLKLTEKLEITQIRVKVLRVPAGRVEAIVKALSANANVEFAEPNYIADVLQTPNDPSLAQQWGLTKIQAATGWNITHGATTVKIAVLDTGIDQNHADLTGKIVANQNFTSSPTADDQFGHGTHVAGIAAAVTNNGVGVAGTGYDCRLMNGKVLGDDGYGDYDWIASGICWAADNGAKVINMSLGGGGGSDTLLNAVNYAWGKGCVIVASAGNSNTTAASYPAYYTNCIAVGATDQNDQRASFSNYDSAWVDVAAPGVGIYSTIPNHTNYISTNYLGGALNYGSLNGTSMAAPFVAGMAGLLWASGAANNTAVRQRIENTCDPAGTWVAKGRVNVPKAIGTVVQYGVQVLNNAQQVTFPKAFASPPIVMTSSQTVSCAASNVTATGFKINLTSDAGTAPASIWVQWIAFIPNPAVDVCGGTLTANGGAHVAFPAMSSTPVIVTNAVKSGKALITNAMNNAANGFDVSIANDQGQSVTGATVYWMAVVPKAQNGFKGEVKTYGSNANVSFTPAFANGPAYVLSATGAIAGAVNNRNNGFSLRLTSHAGAAVNNTWVQWLAYAAP